MHNIYTGRLAEKPVMKEVDMSGEKLSVVNTVFYMDDASATKDERGLRHGTPCPIVAWGENASILASKDKGDEIFIIANSKTVQKRVSVEKATKDEKYSDLFINVPTFGLVVAKFVDKDVANDFDSLFKSFILGTVTKVPK